MLAIDSEDRLIEFLSRTVFNNTAYFELEVAFPKQPSMCSIDIQNDYTKRQIWVQKSLKDPQQKKMLHEAVIVLKKKLVNDKTLSHHEKSDYYFLLYIFELMQNSKWYKATANYKKALENNGFLISIVENFDIRGKIVDKSMEWVDKKYEELMKIKQDYPHLFNSYFLSFYYMSQELHKWHSKEVYFAHMTRLEKIRENDKYLNKQIKKIHKDMTIDCASYWERPKEIKRAKKKAQKEKQKNENE